MKTAKIPHKINHCYTGAFLGDEMLTSSRIRAFEKKTGRSPKIIMWFHAFAKGFIFPSIECMTAKSWGAIPLIKIEPWSWKGKDDDSFSLKKIIDGQFDKNILRFAEGAKRAKTGIFLSFGHEMNANWYPWAGDPEAYKAAFIRVHKIFQKAEADNVTWVFNANADPYKNIAEYYPGNEYVDWLGVDGFNWGTTQEWSRWQPFWDIYTHAFDEMLKLAPKPILVAEFASGEIGGNKAEWIKDALGAIHTMRRIGGFVWFDINKETDWRVDSSPESLEAFRTAIKDPFFI